MKATAAAAHTEGGHVFADAVRNEQARGGATPSSSACGDGGESLRALSLSHTAFNCSNQLITLTWANAFTPFLRHTHKRRHVLFLYATAPRQERVLCFCIFALGSQLVRPGRVGGGSVRSSRMTSRRRVVLISYFGAGGILF